MSGCINKAYTRPLRLHCKKEKDTREIQQTNSLHIISDVAIIQLGVSIIYDQA